MQPATPEEAAQAISQMRAKYELKRKEDVRVNVKRRRDLEEKRDLGNLDSFFD